MSKTLPFDNGHKSPSKLFNDLLYLSYASLVDQKMTHRQASETFALDRQTARKFYHLYITKEFELLTKN